MLATFHHILSREEEFTSGQVERKVNSLWYGADADPRRPSPTEGGDSSREAIPNEGGESCNHS